MKILGVDYESEIQELVGLCELQFRTNLSQNMLRALLGNNLYALIPIVVISVEDALTIGSTGTAQRIQITWSTKATWIREEEDILK